LPNLESADCIRARGELKKFYSIHFDDRFRPSNANLRSQERFLSPELLQKLKDREGLAYDYFTRTEHYPKAFRLGKCAIEADGTATVGILLFWKDAAGQRQASIKARLRKRGGNWVIRKVYEAAK